MGFSINGHVFVIGIPWILYEVIHKSLNHSELPFGGGAIGFVGYTIWFLYEEIGVKSLRIQLGRHMHFFVYESYIWSLTTRRRRYMIEDVLYSELSHKASWKNPWTKCLRNYAFLPQMNLEIWISPLDFKPHIAPHKFEGMW